MLDFIRWRTSQRVGESDVYKLYGLDGGKVFEVWKEQRCPSNVFLIAGPYVIRPFVSYTTPMDCYEFEVNKVAPKTGPNRYPYRYPDERVEPTFKRLQLLIRDIELCFLVRYNSLEGYFGKDASNIAKTLQKGEKKQVVLTQNFEFVEIELVSKGNSGYNNIYDNVYCVKTCNECTFQAAHLYGYGKVIITEVMLRKYLWRLNEENFQKITRREKNKLSLTKICCLENEMTIQIEKLYTFQEYYNKPDNITYYQVEVR